MLNDTAVSDIMTRYLITVSPNTSLDKVTEIFSQHDFHHLPVVEDELLVGIISRHDIERVSHCESLFHNKRDVEYNHRLMKSLLVEEVMTKQVVTLVPDDSLGWAASLFANNKFHALPVLNNGKLVGLVTTFDLIDYAFNARLKPVLTE